MSRRRRVLPLVASVLAAAAPVLAPPVAEVRAQDGGSGPWFSRRFDVTWETEPTRIAAGADGSVYLAGDTRVTDLPGTVTPPPDPGSWRSFLTAFDGDGTVRRTTYLEPGIDGGSSVAALAVGPDGSIWLAGSQRYFPPDEPETGPASGIAITKLAPDGSPLFSTFVGGTRWDTAYDLVPTEDGDAVIAGTTQSADLPVVGALQPVHGGGGLDGFVARVRGDGSGLAWSTYLGGAQDDAATALTLTPGGDVLVVRHVRPAGTGSSYVIDDHDRVDALELVRISADGQLLSTVTLPHGASGGARAVAAAADGSVFVGGTSIESLPGTASWIGPRTEGFVVRVPAGASSVDALRTFPHHRIRRLAATPDGDLVAGTFVDSSSWIDYGSVLLLDPDLRTERSILERRDHEVGADDVAVGPDGAVAVLGRGLGVLHPIGLQNADARMTFVSRLPVRGAAPPTEARAAWSGRRSVRIRWTGGDPAAWYEVERIVRAGSELSAMVVATVPGGGSEIRVTGLDPAEEYRFRLVARFASGVRSAVEVPTALTRPRPISRIDAAHVPGRGVDLRWPATGNGSNVRYVVERRFGTGPFERIPWSPFQDADPLVDPEDPPGYTDALVPFGGPPVAYRVQAVSKGTRFRTRWTYSPYVTLPEPTLRVRQTKGAAGRFVGRDFWFDVEGTFEPVSSNGARFDPDVDRLQVVAGDVGVPNAVSIRRWQWHRRGSVHSTIVDTRDAEICSVDGLYTDRYWWVDVDPGRGWFRIRGFGCVPRGFRPESDTLIVGLSYGGLAGADVRRWEVRPGRAPSLVLR